MVDGEGLVGGGPVEVVAADGVGGFELGADRVLLACAGAARQELPLHLGGQGEPADPAGLEVYVRVALGDDDLAAQLLGDGAEFVHGQVVGAGPRQPYGQHAEPVAAYGHRQVEVDHVVPHLLELRFLAAEGPALRGAVDRQRRFEVRRDGDRLEDAHAVVRQQQPHLLSRVVLGERAARRVQEGMGSGGAQRALHGRVVAQGRVAAFWESRSRVGAAGRQRVAGAWSGRELTGRSGDGTVERCTGGRRRRTLMRSRRRPRWRSNCWTPSKDAVRRP